MYRAEHNQEGHHQAPQRTLGGVFKKESSS
ncbi:hypothetical protein EYF80_058712 [Liparis tanakae]|uniref:Uncharacterized protein n=1 Tax=Liparis tanakae TaxID=230148 RepID=A0A4Z2EQF0_9TELE|nr:hypothetical protein EYF80_058712 [Liparis tanakae]